MGRIAYKVASSFSGFTADQFKNWTNYFCVLILYVDHIMWEEILVR